MLHLTRPSARSTAILVITVFMLITACGPRSGILRLKLPEQYIWIGSSSKDVFSVRFFRTRFFLASPPTRATLYFVGPYAADIFINGLSLVHQQPGFILVNDRPVLVLDISKILRLGSNTIAISASLGSQLAAKIV